MPVTTTPDSAPSLPPVLPKHRQLFYGGEWHEAERGATWEHKQDQLKRFMAAYRETIDWMYTGDAPLKAFAKFNKTDLATARKVRDEFFPKSLIDPDKMIGLDLLNKDGIAFKALSQPLTQQQFDTLIQIPPRQ